MKRTLLAAFATLFLFSGCIGFPADVTVTPALAQGSDVLVADGLRLPRWHTYELYNAQNAGYGTVNVDTVPGYVKQGWWIYDRTAGAWVSHPSVGTPNPQYAASGRDFRRAEPREQGGDVLVADGLQLPRWHAYELYNPENAGYGAVSVGTVPSYVKQGRWIYDRTAGAWVSHPSVGNPNPQYATSGGDFRRAEPREQGSDVLGADGLRLPRSHTYEVYNAGNASYGAVNVDTVPSYVNQGAWIYDRTAGAWVSHPSVGNPNPQYAASGRDSRREELLGQREVDFRTDNDVIEVGRDEGRFQRIRVVVRGAPIQLLDMKVIFADDSVFDPESRDRILREDSVYVFDLPGHRRIIKRITFLYRSIDRREGKATVLVYGEH